MSNYTKLEIKQIDCLYHITKEKFNKPHIKDVDTITNHMINSLQHNNKVNNINNKKYIMIGTLNKIFIRANDKQKLFSYYPIIDIKLNKTNKKERKSCNCIIC